MAEYFNKLQLLANSMRAYGETITDQQMVEKVLQTLSTKFYYVVAAIEQCKDIEQMKVEDLQGKLEAYELKMINKNAKKASEEQALQLQALSRERSTCGRWTKNKA